MRLGNKQKLALSVTATIYFTTYVLVWAGHMTGEAFANFSMIYGPSSLLAILFPAAFRDRGRNVEQDQDIP